MDISDKAKPAHERKTKNHMQPDMTFLKSLMSFLGASLKIFLPMTESPVKLPANRVTNISTRLNT
jgi:hypothetical protein